MAVVFDLMVALDGRRRQVSHLGNHRRDAAGGGTGQIRVIHRHHLMADDLGVEKPQHSGANGSANGSFHRLFRAQHRSQLMPAKQTAGAVGAVWLSNEWISKLFAVLILLAGLKELFGKKDGSGG